jgi:phospholipase C
MGYWTGEDLPWAYSLASAFPVADRWFAPILGQTQPNRRYLLAATSAGMVDDILPENAIPAPEGTIFDRLDDHKIPWRNYYSSFPPTSYVFPGEAIEGHASLVKIAQFFADARRATFPGSRSSTPISATAPGRTRKTPCTPRSSPPPSCKR